jgi:hypothetical protein
MPPPHYNKIKPYNLRNCQSTRNYCMAWSIFDLNLASRCYSQLFLPFEMFYVTRLHPSTASILPSFRSYFLSSTNSLTKFRKSKTFCHRVSAASAQVRACMWPLIVCLRSATDFYNVPFQGENTFAHGTRCASAVPLKNCTVSAIECPVVYSVTHRG